MAKNVKFASAVISAFIGTQLPIAIAADDRGVTDLPTLEVRAFSELGAGPVRGYQATRSTSGTKTDTPLIDIPQTITVIPRALLEDTGGVNVEKAIEYVGGVGKGNNFGGMNLYDLNVRGFATRTAGRNNLVAMRRYDGTADSANIERVEVMMGPSGALYGRGDPGGFYNVITKQPQADRFFQVRGQVGEYGHLRAEIDANSPLNESGSVLGRVNVAAQQGDGFRDFQSSERVFISPILTWQPSVSTLVTLEAEYMEDSRPFDRGLVAVQGNPGALPISRFLGEPDDGDMESDHLLAVAKIDHLAGDWFLRFTTQYKEGTLYGFTAEPGALRADNRTLIRNARLRDYSWDVLTTQVEASRDVYLAAMKHKILIGLEYELFDSREVLNGHNGNVVPWDIDIFDPQYGQPRPAFTSFSTVLDDVSNIAAYIQDQVDITEKLKALASIRVDKFEQTYTREQSINFAAGEISQDRTGMSSRFGLVYQPSETVSLFASYGRTFRPNLDSDVGFATGAGGTPFAPEKGAGYEAGVKLTPLDGRISITAAAFQITKRNVLTTDPNNIGFSIAAGEIESKGFDVNVAGQITPEWRIIGGYANTTTEVTKDNTLPVGASLQNVPEHSLGLFSVYEFLAGAMQGLGVGGGMRYVDERAGDNQASGFTIPSFTKTDLVVFYKPSARWRLQLNVENLFDKRYFDRAFGFNRVVPGQPRTFMGTVSVSF